MSRRRSPVTPTNVKLAVQLAIRHSKLSAAINDMRKMNASHTPPARAGPADRPSTRYFTPYCVPTEQATAATTASKITTCDARPLAEIAQHERKWTIVRIPKDCPCAANPLEENENCQRTRRFRSIGRSAEQFRRDAVNCAINSAARHARQKSDRGVMASARPLMWKNCVSCTMGTSQVRKRSLCGLPVPAAKRGFSNHDDDRRLLRCASRRLLR